MELRVSRSFLFLSTSLLCFNLTNGIAPASTLTYNDGVCEQRVVYDPKKTNGGQLKASFDYLAGAKNPIELPPAITTPEDIAAIDIFEYRRRCAASHRLVAEAAFVALPGLD